MTDADIKTLFDIRQKYQQKMGFGLPQIDPVEIKIWIKTFQLFWVYVDPHLLEGDTLEKRRISAVFLMSRKGIHVPNIIYQLMMARKIELEETIKS
jgi:hypothetical protein